MNWGVVRQTIAYAREAGRRAGKRFTFTLTTNATLLTPEILDELDREEVSLILSLDGRPEVHDAKRCGSSRRVEEAIRMVLDRRAPGGRPAWEYGAAQGATGRGAYAVLRGTYTADNLDFAEDALYMVDEMGSPHFSLEPVIATPTRRMRSGRSTCPGSWPSTSGWRPRWTGGAEKVVPSPSTTSRWRRRRVRACPGGCRAAAPACSTWR